jgi:hypothetical protein
MTTTVLFWRRIDVEGLERLELSVGPDGVSAVSTVLCLEDGGLRWIIAGISARTGGPAPSPWSDGAGGAAASCASSAPDRAGR